MKSLVITAKTTNRESDAFKKYLSEIARIKPFESPEKEYECAMKAFNGDAKAKEELIRRNLRFVVSCAKQYQINDVSLEDLVNEGNIGISTAADRFDPTLGNKFISYAVWYIRKDILVYLSNNSRMIKIPTNKVGAVAKFRRNLSALEQILQRTPTTEDVLSHFPTYKKDDIELLFELMDDSVASLDKPMGEDESTPFHELLTDNSLGRADDLVMKADLEVSIDRMFSVLTPLEKEILNMLFGLDGNTPSTLADVGERFDLSRESVRQKKEKALKKIKSKFRRTAKYLLNDC